MRTCLIHKGVACGRVTAPPSKSYAHRYVLASFLASIDDTHTYCIDNISLSNDIAATVDCVRSLGGNIFVNGNKIEVSPCKLSNNDTTLNCRESGSTMRFIIPISLALIGKTSITGTEKLLSRGLGLYEDIFDTQGIRVKKDRQSFVAEGELKGGHFDVDGTVSSQFITGLLFALPLLKEDSEIEISGEFQSKPYIDITLDVLRQYGIVIEVKDNIFHIAGNQRYIGKSRYCEGDYSNAAFIDFFNHVGGDVFIEGLKENSLQGDSVFRNYFSLLDKGFQTIDIKDCIDLGPILFTMAAVKQGARFTNTKRLRIKESDRVVDMCDELAKVGVKSVINDNEVTIYPIPEDRRGKVQNEKIVFNSHNDHRLAMSLTVLSTLFTATLEDYEAVSKSYPGFFNDIKSLNIDIEEDEK